MTFGHFSPPAAILALCATIAPFAAQAQDDNAPPMRNNTATEVQPIELIPSTVELEGHSYNEEISGDMRVITVTGIANHLVGTFPNLGNPNSITRHDAVLQVPVAPTRLSEPMYFPLIWDFGITRSSTKIDPLAAEWWHGDPDSGWQYEALSGAVDLGLDDNHAHVQPNGEYHYHGWPTGVLEALGAANVKGSPLVGWAADGYPIYTANVTEEPLQTSYRLKAGDRDGGEDGPTGAHDGTFIQDYEYVEDLSVLDECNGTTVVTEDFPQGTYAYIITADYPTYPHCFTGEPDESFMKRR